MSLCQKEEIYRVGWSRVNKFLYHTESIKYTWRFSKNSNWASLISKCVLTTSSQPDYSKIYPILYTNESKCKFTNVERNLTEVKTHLIFYDFILWQKKMFWQELSILYPPEGHLNNSVVHMRDQRNEKKRVVFWGWGSKCVYVWEKEFLLDFCKGHLGVMF